MFRVIRFIIIFFLCSFFGIHHAHAVSNFSTDYHVVYSITDQGVTHAVVKVGLTNTTTQFYASSYKMQIGFDDITNVQAQDGGGAITPKIVKNADGFSVELPFNQKAVGMGTKQEFVLAFDTKKLAQQYGKIWEIDIPGIVNPDEFSSFVVELKVPPSFGQPAYTKPWQPSSSLVFTKQTLGKAGISLAFGDKQVYNYRLIYHLKNPNLFPITTTIALPPSTNYQRVSLLNLEPRPVNVVQDADGNWLAEYRLMSAQSLNVVAQGRVAVHLSPESVPLSDEQKALYTKEAPYWEVTHDKIREKADELRTPAAIYDFVVNKLKYDFKRVSQDNTRLGAVGALQNPTAAVCREFTDLFIAIARAAGIPAREVDGFAYTENAKQRPLSQEKDILHVWPEYYDFDKKTWVMVDPTWGSTTGGVDYFSVNDFAHFAFVIKGVSSEQPLPAGAYKYESNKNEKDVEVHFSLDDVTDKPTITMENLFQNPLIAGLPVEGKVRVSNTSTVLVPPLVVYTTAKQLVPSMQTYGTAGIPPFGYVDVPIAFKPTSFLDTLATSYTVQGVDTTKTFPLSVAPFYMTPIGIGVVVLLGIIFVLFLFRKRK